MPPDAVERPERLQHGVASCRALAVAAHVVGVDQEHAPVLAVLDDEVRDALWCRTIRSAARSGRPSRGPRRSGRASARRRARRTGSARAARRRRPSGRSPTPTASPAGQPDAAGEGETPLPLASTIRPGMSETSPPPLCQMPASEFSSVPTPDSSLHMLVRRSARCAEADDDAAVGSDVAVGGERDVDDAVQQQQRGALHREAFVERHARRVVRRAGDRDREARALFAGGGRERLQVPVRARDALCRSAGASSCRSCRSRGRSRASRSSRGPASGPSSRSSRP